MNETNENQNETSESEDMSAPPDETPDGYTLTEFDAQRWRVTEAWIQAIADAHVYVEIPRLPDDIGEAIHELVDKVWYSRCHLAMLEEGPESTTPDIWGKALAKGADVREKHGEENLGPYTDFEWGMLHGKLSALRWVLGDDWDYLDT